jgi:hypothetical protein
MFEHSTECTSATLDTYDFYRHLLFVIQSAIARALLFTVSCYVARARLFTHLHVLAVAHVPFFSTRIAS